MGINGNKDTNGMMCIKGPHHRDTGLHDGSISAHDGVSGVNGLILLILLMMLIMVLIMVLIIMVTFGGVNHGVNVGIHGDMHADVHTAGHCTPWAP